MIKQLSFNAQDRLLGIIPLMVHHAKACDMSQWICAPNRATTPTLCNTELCAAGWLVYADLIRQGKEESLALVELDREIDIQDRAYTLLGVDQYKDKVGLFYTDAWPKALHDLYHDCNGASRTYNEARAQIMALATRRFVESPLSFKQTEGWLADDGSYIGERRVW